MLTKLMVVALCLLLLTTGTFAGDNSAPEVVVSKEIHVITSTDGTGAPQVIDVRACSEGEAGVFVVSLQELDAAGEKLAKLVAKLEQNGDLTAGGAKKLNTLIKELGANLGGGSDGTSNVKIMRAPSPSNPLVESVDAYVVKLSGEAFGEGAHQLEYKVLVEHEGHADAHGYKVIGDMDQLHLNGVVTDDLIVKIKELKETIEDKEELAIEIKRLFEDRAGEFGSEMNIELEILNLAGEAEGAAQAYVVKMLGDVDIAHAGGHMPVELLTKIEEIKQIHGENGEIAIELKMLFEDEAGNAHEAHGAHSAHKAHGVLLKELHEKHECEGDACDHGGHGALVEIHEGKLKEFHEQMKSAHGEGGHSPLGLMSAPHPPVMLGMEAPLAFIDGHGFGSGADLDQWFQDWDSIMEELAVDLSATQLDLIQNQLDEAKKFLDSFGGAHGAHGLGAMTMPGQKSVEGMAFMFSEDGNIAIPDLLNGEEFKMMWIGEDGEISLDVEELKAEIEKLVQELTELEQEK